MPSRRIFCGLVVACVCLLVQSGLAVAEEIEFFDTLEAARGPDIGDRPLVLVFGASWCGWCRKMEAETLADPAVQELAPRFAWVKIDIDDQPELAALFRVRGVPHTAVLDAHDRLLVARGGFIATEAFREMLTESLQAAPPDDSLEALLAGAPADGENSDAPPAGAPQPAAAALVERLAQADRAGRRQLLAALMERGPPAWPELAALLTDQRLAVRAAANHALRHVTRQTLPFDPFAAAELRQAQAAAWEAWVQEQSPVAP